MIARAAQRALVGIGTLLAPGPLMAQEVEPAPGKLRVAPERSVAEQLAGYDPRTDGWVTEEHSERIGARFGELVALWRERGALTAEDLAPFVAPEVTLAHAAEGLTLIERGAAFDVRRTAAPGEPTEVGAEGIAHALAGLAELLGGSGFRAGLKIEAVEARDGVAGVRLRYQAVGARDGRVVQHTGLWSAELDVAEDAPPRLRALRFDALEEVLGPPAGDTLFSDVTRSAFADVPAFDEQLLHGHNTWQRRLSAALGVSVLGDQGLALGDVDGDGLEDLYLCQPGGLPDRLLRHRADGSFEDVSSAAGVDVLDMTTSALLIDLEGDGDLDLALATALEVLLLENDGNGVFALRAGHPVSTPMSMAAADVDLDGDLDIYVCGYYSPYEDRNAPIPYHDARNGAPNTLLRNDGAFAFVAATEEFGLDHNNDRFSFAAAFEDYDRDGDPDLYVANDFGRNNLYRNDDGRFVDVAAQAGVEDISAGMGVSWGDFDGDGWFDLYVSNMDSKAGRRIAYQRRFRPDSDEESLNAYRRHARGNSLFRNQGDGTFVDVTDERGVARGLWAWGSIFVDLDLDGRLDLCVPNGFATNERYDDL